MVKIFPSQLQGKIALPPSKSHTLRSLLFALMAQGQSHIFNPLSSPDVSAMIQAIRLLGAKVEQHSDFLIITGTAGKLSPSKETIWCGNSGQVFRFICALSALLPSQTILMGDVSIQKNRPIQPLVSALNQLGATASSFPLAVQGPLTQGKATLSGEDSQPISALLIAASFAPHPTELHVTHPGEIPWIDLTLHWLKRFQIPFKNHSHIHYHLPGNASLQGFHYTVPADFSSAAYPIAAALLTQSEITLSSIDMDDPQGDKALIPLLQQMGARLSINSNILHVQKSPPLQGRRIDVNPFIDALPILAVLACFAKGTTELYNGAIARKKESDRISAIAQELTKMGANIEERPDGLLIHSSSLHGHPDLQSHSDHRIALALSIAALAATSESTLHDTHVIAKSYPTFFKDLQKLGAKIE